MKTSELAKQVANYFVDRAESGKQVVDLLPGFHILRLTCPTELEATIYEPAVCLILQGRKETTLGGQTIGFGPGESLIVSHDLPVVSQVTEATLATPYLAIVLTLDVSILHSLYDQVGNAAPSEECARSLDADVTDAALIDVVGRYLALARDPVEAKVVAPLVLKEIHFRLLMAPHGGMLRKLLRHDSHASSIALAIERIRKDFRVPLAIPELARAVGMSASSFHKHFKAVTATTPLQYQKELRLIEARRLLSMEGNTVASVAFEIGYESPTQFSREYVRKFGTPPRDDRVMLSRAAAG